VPGTHHQSCRLGVLAFGDSITNAGGELQWGVALQSWALWTARGLGLPYSGYAVDGAVASDVVREQIPRMRRTAAQPDARFDLGCLYIGVNDIRDAAWNRDAFASDVRTALAFLHERCDRVLAVAAPRLLGRPRAQRVDEVRAEVFGAAARTGALVLDLGDFEARNYVMADGVHPTAFGQIAIAERALAVLADNGMRVTVSPAGLVNYSQTRFGRLRGDLTYLYRWVKAYGRAALGRWATSASRSSAGRRSVQLGCGRRSSRGRP
jgi:lysophospholipase L1-like esterase